MICSHLIRSKKPEINFSHFYTQHLLKDGDKAIFLLSDVVNHSAGLYQNDLSSFLLAGHKFWDIY